MLEGLTVYQQLFCVMGIATVIMMAAFVVWSLVLAMQHLVEHLVTSHKIKHRFAGKPTAKCWCRDCRWHKTDGTCSIPTPDYGFCYQAERKQKEG